jgi:hypothetical protein
MCGLAGFARHPKGAGMDTAWQVFEMMMLQIRHRGTHATGIAVAQKENSFVWKKAAPVDKVLNSDPWKEVADKVQDDATVVQGHVRWATHNNAHLDEAAHPFVEGKIVGCHNGIIRNWREIADKLKRKDMINDSQAPFAMLNDFKNPAKALDTMDGYWALTWTKGASLFLCKTNDASLACAYVPSMQTLFWNSEIRILIATLKEAGIKSDQFDAWEIKPSTIYRYTPQAFDDKGTNAEKIDAPFRGRHVNTNEKFNSTRSTVTTWKDGVATSSNVTNYHGQREIPFSGGSSWDGVNARELPSPRRAQKQLSAGQYTLKEIDEKFTDMMADVYRTIDDLSGRLEVAEAEVDFLRKILDEKGMLDIDVEVEEIDEAVERGDVDAMDCRHGNDDETCDACTTCPACRKPLGDESMFINGEVNLSDGGDCGLVHTKCLFTDGHDAANKAMSTIN